MSIIFKTPKIEEKLHGETCDDLKLSLMLSDESIEIIKSRPSAENILLRQEMFGELLENGKLYADIEKLEKLLDTASGLFRSQNQAVCEAVEIYIFPHLFSYFAEFSRIAAELDAKSSALCEFSKEFKKICSNERFEKAEKLAREVKNALFGASKLFLKTEHENSVLQKENQIDISAELYECARELGVDIKPRQMQPAVLQKGFAEAVQKLFPEQFSAASSFYKEFRTLLFGDIFELLSELRFVLSIVNFTRTAKNANIPYCFPKISTDRNLKLKNIYDITLLQKDCPNIVPNDADFTPDEPFFYLTGANGGGKTTYLRAVGCAVTLFLAGAPVFCEGGECPVFDSVLTHFPKDERFEGSGRFFDEIRRVEALIEAQNGNSLILLNETYATTGEEKAREYTEKLARKLYKSGNYGLYITHQHDVKESEIPFLGVAVDETDRNRRTYRIEKRRLPPKSFASDILEKYGLTKDKLSAQFKKITDK